MGLSEMMGSFAGGSCDSMALLMGGGSEGTLSDNDSRGDDDDDDEVVVFETMSEGVSLLGLASEVTDTTVCLGSGKVSSPRSCTSLRAAFR